MADDEIGGSGYTLEDLSDYLDRGRTPAIAAIDENAECQAVLDALERMGTTATRLVEDDARDIDPGWLDGLMREVAREVKAGRDIALSEEGATRILVTEGALRAMVREAGDRLRGVVVERTAVSGELADPAGPIAIEMVVGVAYGERMQDAAEQVRRAAVEAVARHTGRRVTSVDVTVDALVEGWGGSDA